MVVFGNLENIKNVSYVLNIYFLKIEIVFGIYYVVFRKKNLIFMISLFVFSIILFLSFLVLIEFIGYIMF